MLRTRVRAGAVAGFVMSLAFAAVVTLAQSVDLLVPALAPHVGEATPTTLRMPYTAFVTEAPGGLAFRFGSVIVPRGTVLDGSSALHRMALIYDASRRPLATENLAAMAAVHFILFLLLSQYLRRFGASRTKLMRTQIGIFAAMAGIVVLAKALLLFTALPEMWIPVAAVPLWCTLSIDRRTGFLANVMLAFMTSALLRFDLPLLFVLITRGFGATVLFTNAKRPSQMLPAALGGGIIASAIYAATMIVFQGHFDAQGDVALGMGSRLLACLGGGALGGVIAFFLRLPAERLLGGVSRDKLVDLTDLEQPLLKKMAAEAPGSWEHSRAMANLAEGAASAIGADTLLTRVGAYYHDLGKTIQPKYFVENLAPGERSPHDELDPDVSADAIMAHVVQGAKILREGGIPEPVVEFTYTHHGTQVIEYFWHKCKERGNPKVLSEDFFRYPGMKPQTKETAILMLVDSIEAASRTIQPPERDKFETMVQRILFTKLRSGQLDDSGLTLEDIKTISVKMTDTLVNMFHSRIKYPWQKETPAQPVDLKKAKSQKEKPN